MSSADSAHIFRVDTKAGMCACSCGARVYVTRFRTSKDLRALQISEWQNEHIRKQQAVVCCHCEHPPQWHSETRCCVEHCECKGFLSSAGTGEKQ